MAKKGLSQEIKQRIYSVVDRMYLHLDKQLVRRTKSLELIPTFHNRRGGKYAYGEWAHVAGIFQTLMAQNLSSPTGNHFLDVGCGTGLMGIAARPFIQEGGSYLGIDVMEKDIAFCRTNYPKGEFDFLHFDLANPMYATHQKQELIPWPVAANSKDMVVALSVWTHLSERDARYYLKEVARVLKPGKKAIISFFILDEGYTNSLGKRKNEAGRFHATNQMRWIFDQSAYGSTHWLCPAWTKNPEEAIGITSAGLDLLLAEAGLQLDRLYAGNWKEMPGVYFQDVLVLQKLPS